MASLNPHSGPLGPRKAKHLLRRATFNYSKAEIDRIAAMTAQDAVASFFEPTTDAVPEPQDPSETNSAARYFATGGLNDVSGNDKKNAYTTGWWWHNAMNETSLKHKLTFFLHTSFSTNKNVGFKGAIIFYEHLRLLEHFASTSHNVKELANKITQDHVMMGYLDNHRNNARNPNENYGREFLELFTIMKGEQIGEGNYTNYTEEDVQAASEVLTGYREDDSLTNIDPDTGRKRGIIEPARHVTTDKTFSAAFGNTVIRGRDTVAGIREEHQDLVNMIFDQPETARNYCRKLYRYFVKAYNIDPAVEADIIEPLALELLANNYDLKPTIERLFTSEHFYDMDDLDATDNIIGSIVKNPLQLATEIFSMFNVSYPDPSSTSITELDRFYRYFFRFFLGDAFFVYTGMNLFGPDSVAGYPPNYQQPSYDRNWFVSNTIVARYNLIEYLITGRNGFSPTNPTSRHYASIDTVAFVANNFSNAIAANPNDLVFGIAGLLYPEDIDEGRKDYFKAILTDNLDDSQWTTAWNDYLIDPSGNISTVKNRLDALIKAMVNAAEFQLM